VSAKPVRRQAFACGQLLPARLRLTPTRRLPAPGISGPFSGGFWPFRPRRAGPSRQCDPCRFQNRQKVPLETFVTVCHLTVIAVSETQNVQLPTTPGPDAPSADWPSGPMEAMVAIGQNGYLIAATSAGKVHAIDPVKATNNQSPFGSLCRFPQ